MTRTSKQKTSEDEEKVPALLLEHFKAARARIDQEIASMNAYEVLILSAWGGIYAAYFGFKISDRVFTLMVLSLPVALSIYGLMRYNSQLTVIKRHEAFIKAVEKRTTRYNMHLPGLMTFYDEDKLYFRERPKGPLKAARFVLWSSLIAFSASFFFAAIICPDWVRDLHPKPEAQNARPKTL